MKNAGNKKMTQSEGDSNVVNSGVADNIKNSYFHRITLEWLLFCLLITKSFVTIQV